jgi:hypothetical protein
VKRQSSIEYIFGFGLCLIVVGVTTLLAGQAKTEAKPDVKSGVVSGRVFVITRAGDLKPARIAKVYLLYVDTDEYSAGHFFLTDHEKQLGETFKKLSEEHPDTRVFFGNRLQYHICLAALQDYSISLSRTFDLVSLTKKEWQLITRQTDEEGNFKISVPHAGKYALIVFGQAGFNDAFWIDDSVIVSPGAETTVKMASPVSACVDADD